MKTSNYRVSQSALYVICRLIILNCKSKLAQFISFSPVYSEEYLDGILAEVAEAENLPSEAERALLHSQKHAGLQVKGKECRNIWQRLKRYIYKAFPEDQRAINYNAAGWANYAEASNDNWDKVKALMVAGSNYINALAAELTTMPETFKDEFTALMDEFSAQMLEFHEAQIAASQGTDEKITANNNIYAKVIDICEDGQIIFVNDESVKELFSFEKMSELVTPPGASSMVVTVLNGTNNQPMPNSTVIIRGETFTTDQNGRVTKHQLSAGPAPLVADADGFITFEETIELKTGSTKHVTVTLQPMVTGELSPGPVSSAEVTEEETENVQ